MKLPLLADVKWNEGPSAEERPPVLHRAPHGPRRPFPPHWLQGSRTLASSTSFLSRQGRADCLVLRGGEGGRGAGGGIRADLSPNHQHHHLLCSRGNPPPLLIPTVIFSRPPREPGEPGHQAPFVLSGSGLRKSFAGTTEAQFSGPLPGPGTPPPLPPPAHSLN